MYLYTLTSEIWAERNFWAEEGNAVFFKLHFPTRVEKCYFTGRHISEDIIIHRCTHCVANSQTLSNKLTYWISDAILFATKTLICFYLQIFHFSVEHLLSKVNEFEPTYWNVLMQSQEVILQCLGCNLYLSKWENVHLHIKRCFLLFTHTLSKVWEEDMEELNVHS